MKNIYLITNKVTGKQYVGKTKQNIMERLKQHKWCNYGTKLHLSIIKYGLDKFNIELLEQVDDNIALQKEIYYTNLYNTVFPNGYNEMVGQSLSGGNNRMGGKHLPKNWRIHCSRPGIRNGRANIYEIGFLDTNDRVRVNLRTGICDYLGISRATVKKYMNKPHICHKSKRPVIFYCVGRVN